MKLAAASEELRVGLVGGWRGQVLAKAIAKQKNLRVVAVCDLDSHKANYFVKELELEAAYTDYRKFLSHGLDVVIVATPPHLHAEHAICALQAGCHVISEIPAVVSVDQARQLVRAVRSSDKVYMLAENCLFRSSIQSWKNMTDQGCLGETVYAEGEYLIGWSPQNDTSQTADWRDEFPPIQYCTHSLGPILHLLQDRCLTVLGLGTGHRINPKKTADDIQVGLFRTTKGAVIKILVGFSVVRRPSLHYYSIYGTKGSLETSRDGKEETLTFCSDNPHLQKKSHFPNSSHPDHSKDQFYAERAMMEAFVKTIRQEIPNPLDVYAGLDCTLPGIIAQKSAQQGGIWLEVPDPRSFE
jgi:predicted dehydrogenase